MKIALVHDYIKEYGGAERVLESLHDLYPDAPIYTSVYLPSYLGPHKERFKDFKIKTSWAQYIPFKAKLISPLRLISPFLFASFDLSSYDVIISSATGAYFPNNVTKGKAKLVCYCHTPPRYLYGYATAREWRKNKVLNIVGGIMNHILRMVDYNVAQKVDYFIANSEEVRGRIRKFYRLDATVIYPPVQIPQTTGDEKSGDYFITGGRLARAKHVDLIIKACLKAGVALKIFGKGFAGYDEELQKIAGKKGKIEFVGEVTDTEKLSLMKEAKAFLFASEDEDFGITPVEAMGQGLPVIAYNSGGVKETIIEGKTGLFFNELTAESLAEKIKEFEKKKWNREESIKRAKEFDEEVFKKEIKKYISSLK